MRVAMTLVVRDEADVIDAWLRYHFARGVDFVIATDHRSVDGTSDILQAYEAEGRLVLLREDGDVLRQAEWMTRMARIAATEHGAAWVLNSDADEFWWPRGGSIAEILHAVPPRFGVVRALMRHFVLRTGTSAFSERMTVRARPTTDLSSPYHAQVKVAHRGAAEATVSVGNHDVDGAGLLLREWFPFDLLHFPVRSEEQLEDKFLRRATSPDGQHIVRALDLLARGEGAALLRETLVDDATLEKGVRAGALVRDVRLRDALRALNVHGTLAPDAPLTLHDDADLAIDAHLALEHDSAVLVGRRCEALEDALAVLEQRGSILSRVARRLTASHAGTLG
jgi:hypothetical protein